MLKAILFFSLGAITKFYFDKYVINDKNMKKNDEIDFYNKNDSEDNKNKNINDNIPKDSGFIDTDVGFFFQT